MTIISQNNIAVNFYDIYHTDKIIIECYQNLANAVIQQAVSDYICALKACRKKRRIKYYTAIIDDVENFFRSQYFSILTNLDYGHLAKKIKQECEEDG